MGFRAGGPSYDKELKQIRERLETLENGGRASSGPDARIRRLLKSMWDSIKGFVLRKIAEGGWDWLSTLFRKPA